MSPEFGSVGGRPVSVEPQYEDRVLAYLDVLGWAAFIEATASERSRLGEAAPLLGAYLFEERASELMRQPPLVPTEMWQTSVFSDSIAISLPYSDTAMFWVLDRVKRLCASALNAGFFVRGGVVRGSLFHDGTLLVGPSMVAAVALEKKSIVPRVVIADELVREAVLASKVSGEHGEHLYREPRVRRDADGMHFLDILGPWNSVGLGAETSRPLYAVSIARAQDFVRKALVAHAGSPHIHLKYVWFANYLNAVIQEQAWLREPPYELQSMTMTPVLVDPWEDPEYSEHPAGIEMRVLARFSAPP